MSKKILIIDDEEELCELLKRCLALINCDASYTTIAKGAVELVKKDKYDIVFLDLMMPDSTGDVLLKQIKKESPETKVIMMTGKSISKNVIEELKQKGASDCLIKNSDFNIETIFRVVAEE